MSDYGWLRGEYKLPRKEWINFRNSLINSVNSELDEAYNTAISLYKECKKERGFLRKLAFVKSNHNEQNLLADKIVFSILNEKTKKITKPKKKDFAHYKQNTKIIEGEELEIIFDNKTCTVKFISDDGNHSQDNVLDYKLGKYFMYLINRVQWTNRTGGYLRYYCEHMRDNGLEARECYQTGKHKVRFT